MGRPPVKPEYRTVVAFLGASVVPAAYQAIAFPLSGERDTISFLGTFVVAYWFSTLATVIVGIPALLLLSKFGLVGWGSAVGSGALAGLVTYVALLAGHVEGPVALRFLILGAGAGLVFWLVFRSGPSWPPVSNGA